MADAPTTPSLADTKMPPMHVVFGAYGGPINANPGEKILFMGDCAEYHGDIAGQPVNMDTVYQDRSTKDPLKVKHPDIYKKMVEVTLKMRALRHNDVLRLPGCPVSVAEQVLALVKMGNLKNPYLDPKQALGFTSCYLSWRTRLAMRALIGRKYNLPGPVRRGASRPAQSLPPPAADGRLEWQS